MALREYDNETKPAEETAFSATAGAFDRSRLLAQRVQQLADRLLGSIPVQAGNTAAGTAASERDPVFPELQRNANRTRGEVEAGLEAIDRIECQLP